MKKCPRCKKNIPDRYQYCPHCGMNLNQKPDTRRYLYYIILLVLPILYYFSISNNIITDNTTDKIVLKEITDTPATSILYQFPSLETFSDKVEDTDKYIKTIQDYEATISADANKEYLVSILNNYDINFKLMYSFVDNDLLIDIHKQYTRSESLDYLEHSFTQKGISSLEDIVFNKEIMSQYVNTDELEKLYNQLLTRSNEFNSKIEYIGHFGFGEYSDHASVVVYPDGDNFKVTFQYKVMK